MADRIQLRRDTISNWNSVNPILAQGELGIELDTAKFKLGNGTGHWLTLPYIISTSAEAVSADLMTYIDVQDGNVISSSVTYTDDTSGRISNAVNIQDASVLTQAKAYSDLSDFWNRSSPTLTPKTSTDNISLNTSTQTYAPIILTPQVATPTTQLVDGAIMIRNGQAWLYDATRTKWVSFDSAQWQWAANGNSDGVALAYGGTLTNMASGPSMLYDGTIVGISAKSSGGLATKQIDVYINNALNFSFNLAANVYSDTTRNVNFNAGDFLGVFVNAAGANVADLAVVLHTKWRI